VTWHFPLLFERGSNGAQVPLNCSIINNFMIYQDRLETNLLQLFAHTENSERFSTLSVIIFKVHIIAERVIAKRMTIMGALLH